MEQVLFAVRLIGGPYDGERGLAWLEDREQHGSAPPKQLLVGRCRGDGSCGAITVCAQPHVALWDSAERSTMPLGGAEYTRVEIEVIGWQRGRVRYVHASVPLSSPALACVELEGWRAVSGEGPLSNLEEA